MDRKLSFTFFAVSPLFCLLEMIDVVANQGVSDFLMTEVVWIYFANVPTSFYWLLF